MRQFIKVIGTRQVLPREIIGYLEFFTYKKHESNSFLIYL